MKNYKSWEAYMNKDETWFQSFEYCLKQKQYSAVLTISSPIQSHIEALKLAKSGYFKDKNIKWIAYFLDPFATFMRHKTNPNQQGFLQFETEVYQYADAIFTSPEMYQENMSYPMGTYIAKTYPVQFASMKPKQEWPYPSFFEKDNINIVYTGSLFDHSIRKPDYFFQLVSSLPSNMHTYIACNLSNSITDGLKETYLDGKENIHWLGTQPIETCFSMMNHADVLVNLGNEASNQTPSKVFDYIGMQRPIASFYSIENDTSLKYLKDYPYYLAIQNKDSLTNEDRNAFIDFATTFKHEKIDSQAIETAYHQYMPDVLAKIFKEKFNTVLKK